SLYQQALRTSIATGLHMHTCTVALLRRLHEISPSAARAFRVCLSVTNYAVLGRRVSFRKVISINILYVYFFPLFRFATQQSTASSSDMRCLFGVSQVVEREKVCCLSQRRRRKNAAATNAFVCLHETCISVFLCLFVFVVSQQHTSVYVCMCVCVLRS